MIKIKREQSSLQYCLSYLYTMNSKWSILISFEILNYLGSNFWEFYWISRKEGSIEYSVGRTTSRSSFFDSLCTGIECLLVYVCFVDLKISKCIDMDIINILFFVLSAVHLPVSLFHLSIVTFNEARRTSLDYFSCVH